MGLGPRELQLKALREANCRSTSESTNAPKGMILQSTSSPKPVMSSSFDGLASHVRRRGRPTLGEIALTYQALKPWVVLGISRSTWYARRASRQPLPPPYP